MRVAISTDEFLELEEEARRVAKLRAPAREVRRFHAAVRRFATTWSSRPGRRTTSSTAADGVTLHLEIEDEGRWIPVMDLHAAHPGGEFGLRGPNPERKRRMSSKLREAMDGLAKTWKALPGSEALPGSTFVVHLPKLADVGFDRFLEVTIDACRGI